MVSEAGTLRRVARALDPRTAERMTAHILQLAEDHGIQVTWVSSWRAAIAFHEPQHVYVPKVRRASDYLFALHEIGHLVSPESLASWDAEPAAYHAVLCEGAAWAWAVTNASRALLRHARAKDWDTVAYAYRTYLQSSG